MNRRVLGSAGALILGSLGAYFVSGGGGGTLGLAVGRCGIGITSPARARDGKVYLRSGQSLTIAMTGTATRCPNTTITRTFNDGGTASISVDDAGTWSSSTTVADGVLTTITVSSVDGGSIPLVVDANTAKARIQLTAPTRGDWDVWYLVSSKVDAGCGGGGNINAERFARAGFVSDIDCADGGQFAPSVTVTGASGGWLSVKWNGVALVDAGIGSSPATLTPGTLTLPELGVGELVVSVLQSDGGGDSLTTYATVRTLTPPSLLGADGGAPVLTLLNQRAATVAVSYVLPHIPVEIGAAHTEFVWTTSSVPCYPGPPNFTTRGSGECHTLDEADAGFFVVTVNLATNSICGTVAVPDGGCAYGSELIWVKSDGGTTAARTLPEVGDKLGIAAVTRHGSCAGTIFLVDPVGPCVPPPTSRPPANAYNMTDGGGSARDHWDRFYGPTGVALTYGLYSVFDPNVVLFPSNSNTTGYLSERSKVQDCRLYDADSTPQIWKCVDGSTQLEGAVRSGTVYLPPINTYVIIPVLVW